MKMMLYGLLLLLPGILAQQGDFAALDPEAAAVAEDPHFDPYDDKPRGVGAGAEYAPRARTVESFDFDPSEGLTFYVEGESRECFYQDAKFEGDELGGAYVVSSADSHIDLEVKNPEGVTIFRRLGDAEGQYLVTPKQAGVHELCFSNPDSDGKLVTHVTNTLQSQHPVEKEHVSVLAKYASHLDVRLGELESEQRLQLIRTDRHIKVDEEMNKHVMFYGALECAVYLVVCFFQVFYIKSLLDSPRKARTWV
ncbi:Transmembrane emp24 domain-containing protein 1 [Phytophthora cinnamomi]|uniref:Transmembrane emp24 domain-containing protein 1 n=1 Tax=Phytophthora cinnamomi TaxID=4785 RepID=UPI00355980B3|nr:Transmembrane emp24 domain-containing protein 1 [Phytophthora cinnamomi]